MKMVLHDKVEDARKLEDENEVMMVPSQEDTTMMVEMADVMFNDRMYRDGDGQPRHEHVHGGGGDGES